MPLGSDATEVAPLGMARGPERGVMPSPRQRWTFPGPYRRTSTTPSRRHVGRGSSPPGPVGQHWPPRPASKHPGRDPRPSWPLRDPPHRSRRLPTSGRQPRARPARPDPLRRWHHAIIALAPSPNLQRARRSNDQPPRADQASRVRSATFATSYYESCSTPAAPTGTGSPPSPRANRRVRLPVVTSLRQFLTQPGWTDHYSLPDRPATRVLCA